MDEKGNRMGDGSEYNAHDGGSEEKMVTGLTMDLVPREVGVLKKPVSPEAGDEK